MIIFNTFWKGIEKNGSCKVDSNNNKVTKKERYLSKNNRNSESKNISDDKNQMALSNEHMQRSRNHFSSSSSVSIRSIEEQNKKKIFRIERTNIWEWSYRRQMVYVTTQL